MATTIGRVEYEAGIDGSKMPRQARRVGKELGSDLGKAFDAEFGKTLSKLGNELARDMRDHGELGGRSFTDAMQDAIRGRLGNIVNDVAEAFSDNRSLRQYVDDLGGVEEGSEKLRDQLRELVSSGQMTDKMFYRLSGTLAQQQGEWRKTARAEKEVADEGDRLNASLDRLIQSQNEELVLHELNRQAAEKHADEMHRLGEAHRNLDAVLGDDKHRRAFIEWAGGADEAAHRLRIDLDEMFEKGSIDLDEYGRKLRDVDIAMRDFGDGAEKSDRQHESLWKNLSFNARQAIVIVGAVAAAGPQIAALGSFVGSSVTIMASALTSLGIGAGVAFAGLKDLGEEVSSLPEEIQPAAEAWQGFMDGLGALQDSISLAMLPQLAEPFERLTAVLPSLEGPFDRIAEAVANVVTHLVDTVTEAQNLENLQGFLESTAKVFELLSDAAIEFGEGIGEVFVIAEPFVEAFSEKVLEIAEGFRKWTESDEGRAAITEWFENAQTLAGPFLELVGAVGQALANIVTPEVIEMTATFLEDLAGAMGLFESLMGVMSELNAFGLIAQLLNDVGAALEPVMALLEPLASWIGTAVSNTITGISVAINLLTPLLWPLQVAFEVMNTIFEKFSAYMMPIVEGVGGIGTAINDELQTALDEVLPSIEAVVDEIIAMLPPQEEVVAFIKNEMIPWVLNNLGPALEQWKDWITDVAASIKNDLIPWIRDEFVPVMRDKVIPAVEKAIDFFTTMFNIIGDVADAISGLVGWIGDLASAIFNLPSMPDINLPGGGGGGGGMASGGIVTSGARRLIGEAGPEAVVPLDRPLNQVDPAVRALSAFAQGLGVDGGPAGPGIYVAPGAIVVSTQASAVQTADMVLDRFVEEART